MSATSFQFLHASDFHLDEPLRGLRELPDELIDLLLDAKYQAVDAVVDAALREQVAFVVLSGDIVDLTAARPRTIDFVVRQFERLAEAKIPVYWLGGELERGRVVPKEVSLPANVHRLSTDNVQTLEVRRGRKTIAYVVGQSSSEHGFANLEEMRVPRDGRFFVGAFRAPKAEALNRDQLDDLGIDYWALGGLHQRRELETLIPAHFSGAPQGQHPTEPGPHGCLLVQVTGDDIDEVRFVETDRLRYRTETVTLASDEKREQLLAKMHSRLQTIRHDVDATKPLLVSWCVEEESKLGAELRKPGHADELLREFLTWQKRHGAIPGTYHVSLQAVGAALSAEFYDEESILGDFLRAVRTQEQAVDPTLDVERYLPQRPSVKTLSEYLQGARERPREVHLAQVTLLGVDLLRGELE